MSIEKPLSHRSYCSQLKQNKCTLKTVAGIKCVAENDKSIILWF